MPTGNGATRALWNFCGNESELTAFPIAKATPIAYQSAPPTSRRAALKMLSATCRHRVGKQLLGWSYEFLSVVWRSRHECVIAPELYSDRGVPSRIRLQWKNSGGICER